MYFEGLEAVPLIFSGCYEHNISEYKKALSWAQRNGYKSDIENLKREIAEEQAKLNEENSMTLIGKFIKKISYKSGGANV